MRQRHYAIIKGENGEAKHFPLKSWVRQNLTTLPEGIYSDGDTSHILRRNLKNIGWRKESTENEIFIIKPDENGKFDYADSLINMIDQEEIETLAEESNEITFRLEEDLQNALRKNILGLEKGLSIIDGGKEKYTEAGFIDITAEDNNGNIIAIELKAGLAKPAVIAQVLAYMTALKNESNKPVRGIIVASDFDDRVKLAAQAINNVKLVEYAMQFNFKNIN
jgi:RecB family endonuclease NucS